MGCTESIPADKVAKDALIEKAINLLKESLAVFSMMDGDVELIKKCFQKIDMTRDGSIEVAEIEIFLQTERVPFNERILMMYDSNCSGQLEFPEFLLMCWTYCTMDSACIEKFVFDLYSTDPKSGCMSGEGLEKLVKDLFGRKNKGQIKTMTKEILKGFALKFPDFQNFVRGHQALMLPAFRFQSELRRSVIGENYWLKKSAVRKSIPREIVDASFERGKNALKGPERKKTKGRGKKNNVMPTPTEVVLISSSDKEKIKKKKVKKNDHAINPNAAPIHNIQGIGCNSCDLPPFQTQTPHHASRLNTEKNVNAEV